MCDPMKVRETVSSRGLGTSAVSPEKLLFVVEHCCKCVHSEVTVGEYAGNLVRYHRSDHSVIVVEVGKESAVSESKFMYYRE